MAALVILVTAGASIVLATTTPVAAAVLTYYAASSATGTGDCSTPANACGLQTALNTVGPSDTVDLVTPGTTALYENSGGFFLPLVAGSVTIQPLPGVSNPTLDGQNAASVLTLEGGTVNVDGVTIQHGSVAGGGGIRDDGGTLNVADTALVDNVSTTTGGAIDTIGDLNISDSTISDNGALLEGGAILATGSSLTISGTTISDNTTSGFGEGGIFTPTATTISDSTFSGNTALDGGGAIADADGGDSTVTSSTIWGNTATALVQGGGISIDPVSSAAFEASIVAANTADGLDSNCYDPAGTIVSNGYNLTNDDGTGCGFSASTDVTDSALDLGPLAYNGGPTQTLMPTSDLATVIPTSVGVPVCPGTDQRGAARPAPDATDCTIGAVEYAAGVPAAITSDAAATFAVGTTSSFIVTTAGSPTPQVSELGPLPQGVSFTDEGNGTATLAGTPAKGTGGSYPITISAANGVSPDAVQAGVVVVDQAPSITSYNATTFTVGQANRFPLTARGSPAPSFTETGALPAGVTFSPSGLVSGTPAPNTTGKYLLAVTATNGIGTPATQRLWLRVVTPRALLVLSAHGVQLFTNGVG